MQALENAPIKIADMGFISLSDTQKPVNISVF